MEVKQPYISSPLPKTQTDVQMSEMDKTKLKKAAVEMEGEFLKILMKQMKNTLSPVESENEAPGKDIMTDFMIERFAEDVAKEEPLGIAKMIYDQYTKRGTGK